MSLLRTTVAAGLAGALTACSTQNVPIFEPRKAGDAGNVGEDAAVPAGSVRAIAAFDHSCALDDEGALCWGPNGQSMLGLDAAGAEVHAPRRLASSSAYTALCTGELHSCALRNDGEIECWGGNARGQLGLGDTRARSERTALRSGVRFSQLACGGEATCAVAEDGTLYCWGNNHEGMPGQADAYDAPDVLKPQKVAVLARGVRQVSMGQGHVCAVMSSGALYCWGRNSDKQLGIGTADPHLRAPQEVDVGGLVQHVAAGQEHSCAVRRDGRLFCWGSDDGNSGRLGLGEGTATKVDVPQQVGTLSDYREVGANWFHSCARRASGVLLCWGRNEEGQLGLGDNQPRYTPTALPGSWGAFVVAHFHTCALDAERLYCWGQNAQGQSGLGDDVDRTSEPTRVPLEQAQ